MADFSILDPLGIIKQRNPDLERRANIELDEINRKLTNVVQDIGRIEARLPMRFRVGNDMLVSQQLDHAKGLINASIATIRLRKTRF